MKRPQTVRERRDTGDKPRTVKMAMREKLSRAIEGGQVRFPGIIGYDKTALPQIENAILSGHDFILLGLRGQAKTRILRSLSRFLDEWIPAVEGCEINDDPMSPLCPICKQRVEAEGDNLPVRWIHRSERYREKLAT